MPLMLLNLWMILGAIDVIKRIELYIKIAHKIMFPHCETYIQFEHDLLQNDSYYQSFHFRLCMLYNYVQYFKGQTSQVAGVV